ncbi:MAG: FKBP-type peptidyl-prolyl cis-trans isomerase [Leadbetterella sp.]
MKKLSFSFLVFCGLFLSSCLNNFVETEQELITKQEEEAFYAYIAANPGFIKDPLNESPVHYKITKSNPSGKVSEASDDFWVTYTIKNFQGKEILKKIEKDSVTLSGQNLQGTILGVQRALTLLKDNESGTFVIPSGMAYGKNPPSGLQADEPIVMDFTILKTITEANRMDSYIVSKKLTTTEILPSGTRVVKTTIAPANEPILANGEKINIKYVGKFLNGTVFDKGDQLLPHTVGVKGSLINGFAEGIERFKKGEKGVLVIPHREGYGVNGFSSIPGYSTLVFDVEIQK